MNKNKAKNKELKYKTFRGVVKETDVENGVIDMMIPMSTSSVDRDGDIVDPTAFKNTLPAFEKRPILLSSHDYRSLQSQIGEFEAIKATADGLVASPKYYINEGNAEADWAFKLASKGKAAFSVGFIPIKAEPIGDKNDNFPQPQKFTEVELLEVSQVVVPSNRDAIQSMKSKGIDNPVTEEIAEEVLADEGLLDDETDKQKYKGTISWARAHPDGTPKAPDDEAWNGTREVREANIEDLLIMSLWVGEDIEVKASYKLPHHEAGGPHRVVRQGVIAAGNALQGARGGVEIPPSDVGGVKRHLARHYRQFDLTPPWEQDSYSQESIADDMDYLMSQLEANGLNEAGEEVGLKLVALILRLTGDDIPDEIQERFIEFLPRVKEKPAEIATEALNITPIEQSAFPSSEVIAEMVGTAVKVELDKLKGKVD
tara:strand:- start:13629 stop:14912 length:1284 start_codon:yes stop_codon:yes gene_type:complete